MNKTCIYCDAKAVRWCDYVIGFNAENADHRGVMKSIKNCVIYRCDSGLCAEHAVFKGNIFFDGSPKVTGVESVDWCIGHHVPDRISFNPVTKEEVEGIRRRHRCQAKGAFKIVPVPQPDLFAGVPCQK